MKRHFLHPGEVRFSVHSERIETILGSCISVTLRDPLSLASAMCHCVLPQAPTNLKDEQRFRYCDAAIPAMLDWFADRGIPMLRLEVKIFGGAEVLPGQRAPSTTPMVGSLNAQASLAVLHSIGLPPLAHDLGGPAGRRLVFDTASGDVWIRNLEAQLMPPLEEQGI